MTQHQCPSERSIEAYADGELSQTLAERLQEHLSHCATCAELFSQVARAREFGQVLREALEDVAAPQSLWPAVRRRLRRRLRLPLAEKVVPGWAFGLALGLIGLLGGYGLRLGQPADTGATELMLLPDVSGNLVQTTAYWGGRTYTSDGHTITFSDDAGAHWHDTGCSGNAITSLYPDPRDAGVLYFAGLDRLGRCRLRRPAAAPASGLRSAAPNEAAAQAIADLINLAGHTPAAQALASLSQLPLPPELLFPLAFQADGGALPRQLTARFQVPLNRPEGHYTFDPAQGQWQFQEGGPHTRLSWRFPDPLSGPYQAELELSAQGLGGALPKVVAVELQVDGSERAAAYLVGDGNWLSVAGRNEDQGFWLSVPGQGRVGQLALSRLNNLPLALEFVIESARIVDQRRTILVDLVARRGRP